MSAASYASTISASSNSNPSSGNAQKDGSNRSVKQNTTPKMTQKGRKESPSDSNRQTNTPKAWSGSNPITQRSSTPNQAKASSAQTRNVPTVKMPSTKDVQTDKHNSDRLRFLFGGSVGLQVVLITKSGDKYEGVFAGYAGAPAASKITLKMTKKVINNPITQPNGISSWEAAFVGSSPDYAMTFDLQDMADMTIPEFSLPETSRQINGASSSFQTDADISGDVNRSERVLQKWVPDAADTTDFSLESGSAAGWDQFATHAKMTGGQSTYHEEAYTTTIDRSAPDFKKREAEAARLAREIESQVSSNTHVREERGQALEQDQGDEEDKYSGVRRDYLPLPTTNANRYTPPALRAPSAKPAASGVPVDPAIISSQVARPDISRSSGSRQSVPLKGDTPSAENPIPPAAVLLVAQTAGDEAAVKEQALDLSRSPANGVTPKASQQRKLASPSPEHAQNPALASQGVEKKVLGEFKQFADVERARVAEKKRMQTKHDRDAKINELRQFAKRFKLKTPIPDDLVGILAKDPKKQEAIMDKAQRDHEDAKSVVTPLPIPQSTSTQLPAVPKFDKSQIPPPIPERNAFNAGRGSYAKSSIGRGARPLGQQLPFGGTGVPVAPRGQGQKNGQIPAPIPLPELRSHQSTAGSSALSSPRGTDTPTSAVSTKFNVRALEFRPTAPSFNPSSASVSAASPSPIKRVASIARTATPSSFFGQHKPRRSSERLNLTQAFNPISRMKQEVKAKLAENTEDKRDFASNGGIPNAFHTNPVWVVPDENKDKTHEDFFNKEVPTASPLANRTPSHHTIPFQGQMQQLGGAPHIPQAVTPQHGHHVGQHYPPHFDDQRMHLQNGSPSMYTSPNMTPRGAYASPMSHPTQTAYGPQPYFVNGPMPMRPYGNNAAMMHGQHGQMVAPMMSAQHSSNGYMTMPNQMNMVYPSPRIHHAYPQQQNGYPSPGPMAPVMMHQNSQQGYPAGQMMFSTPGHAGNMYGQQPSMGRGYGGNTPYGSSPHQPHYLNQRALSQGYQKGVPQMSGGAPNNAPQQPSAFGQMPVADEA